MSKLTYRLFALTLIITFATSASAKTIIPTIPDAEAQYDAFTVMVNGEPAPVWQCRVSAIPFNRVWPGYQRALDQTELAGFVTWETDEATTKVVVRVSGDAPLESIVVRPLALGITPTVNRETREISFAVPRTQPCVLEVNGFHHALHLLPFPIYERPRDLNAPNLKYFGPGVHKVGVLEVKSGDEIFVDSGAVVYGGVRGDNVENVKVSGPGIIDAAPFERGAIGGIFRFTNSRNITVDGIVQRDTDVWSTTLHMCDDVVIRNTKLVGLWRYNADGIDVCNCERVLVEKSFLRTFDDSLVVKGIGETEKSVNDLVFRQNVVWCDWGRAMELGAETRAPEMKNIRFEDSDIIRTTHIAMDIQHGDRAKISNVLFDNIRVEFDDVIPPPIYQHTDEQRYDPNADPNFCPKLAEIIILKTPYSQDEQNGTVDSITFRNIRVLGARRPNVNLQGLDDQHKVSNVLFEEIYFNDVRVQALDEIPMTKNQFVEQTTLQ